MDNQNYQNQESSSNTEDSQAKAKNNSLRNDKILWAISIVVIVIEIVFLIYLYVFI